MKNIGGYSSCYRREKLEDFGKYINIQMYKMGRKNSSVKLINVCKCINAVFGKVGVDANKARLKRRISHVPNLMRSAEDLLFSLICIRFGTCALRCLDRAFVTPFVKMCIKYFSLLFFWPQHYFFPVWHLTQGVFDYRKQPFASHGGIYLFFLFVCFLRTIMATLTHPSLQLLNFKGQ